MTEEPTTNPLKRDKKGRLVKGTPPGPGRTKGSVSIITEVKRKFKEEPEKLKEFVDRYMKNPNNEKHVTEMVDGKPAQSIDMEVTLPKPIMDITNGVLQDNSNKEDSEIDEED